MRSFGCAVLFLLLTFGFSSLGFSQGTTADYERMNAQSRLNNRLLDRNRFAAHWLAEDQAMWYTIDNAVDDAEYHLVKPATGENLRLFSASELAERLKDDVEQASTLKSLSLTFDLNEDAVFFSAGGDQFRFQIDSGELTQVTNADVPAAEKSNSILVKPSGGSSENSTLTFRNNTDKPLQLYWIDSQLRPRQYDDVPVGGVHRQNTYVGHQWLVRDKSGKNIAWVESQNPTQEFVVTSQMQVELAVPESIGRMGAFFLRGNANYERPRRERFNRGRSSDSPDGEWKAVVRDHNLFLIGSDKSETPESESLKSETQDIEIQMTTDGSAEDFYTNRVFWSPDSQYLVALREVPAEEHTVHMVESSPRDQLQPKLHSHNYLKPGDRIQKLQPHLFSVRERKEVPLSNQLFENPWQLSDFQWSEDSMEFRFRYNQRGHQVMRMVGIGIDGTCRAIVEDVVETFIDYTNKIFWRYVDEERKLIWASERSGMNHLYMIDVAKGEVIQPITEGDWVLRRVLKVDEEERRIWFSACGVYPDQDPYYLHFGAVDFDGENLVWLTDGDGNHSIEYSPDRKFIVDTFSRVDMPPRRQLRDATTGKLICELEKADMQRLVAAGWQPPERFTAKGRDGETDIYGVIYRPQNFDSNLRYPVIEYIYAGPHDAFVPKSFGPSRREKSLAELGFIVVQIDGMGTNHRGKKFHDVCWQNIGDSGFPDRIQWMKSAAAKYPAMDISRVGIYGGSAGGQSSTRALLAYGDFYKAAVSDCGCHDNRMDKIWWNEQWMGWPIGPHYEEQSNVTQAHRLEGKLMLLVGELDRNVDPASTMQVVDALIKADKDFDLVVFPGAGHGAGSSRYGWRRTCDFFVRHLLGVQPRAN